MKKPQNLVFPLGHEAGPWLQAGRDKQLIGGMIIDCAGLNVKNSNRLAMTRFGAQPIARIDVCSEIR